VKSHRKESGQTEKKENGEAGKHTQSMGWDAVLD